MLNLTTNRVIVLTIILSLMFITRGSHFLTELNLPDMSLILFLVLGFFIPSLTLFFALFFVNHSSSEKVCIIEKHEYFGLNVVLH